MRARLLRSEPLTDTVTTFYFEPEQPVYYLAGQFTELTLPHQPYDERGTTRQFTLSSSPGEPELAITVNFADSRSSFKRALRLLPAGSEVHLYEPLGDFVLPLNPATPMAWVAGGVGITPFRSMAKFLSDSRETREIALFHGVHDRSEAHFTDIFGAAGITPRISETSQESRLSAETVLRQLDSAAGRLFYISGPEAMVTAMRQDFIAAGVNPGDIITDAFLGYQ
jgi:ferredoxin-NADP reductase